MIRTLAISPQMKSRLDRIDALISEGYTLNKIWGFYPDLKTSAGKSVEIFGSLFRLAGPASFSWVAFSSRGLSAHKSGSGHFFIHYSFSLSSIQS